jgi:hypothetical protein
MIKTMNGGVGLEAEAARILREIPGVDVIREPNHRAAGRPDFILQFAGNRTPLAVEVKQRANAATAWQLVHHAQALRAAPLLLIAGETTAEARQILAAHGVGVIDTLGNAHIQLPGLLLHLQGNEARRPMRGAATSPTRLRGKAGIAALALLLNPDRTWKVQDLAAEADVATGLAHRVLTRLEADGVVQSEGVAKNRVRRVTDPTALLDLWTEENIQKEARVLGYALAQTPQQLVRALGGRLQAADIAYAYTGPSAGALVAPFITAVPVVDLYVTEHVALADLFAQSQVQEVSDGQNIVFHQVRDDAPLAFRQQIKDIWTVNRFRLYADLKRDPRRGSEQAEYLRREVIGF